MAVVVEFSEERIVTEAEARWTTAAREPRDVRNRVGEIRGNGWAGDIDVSRAIGGDSVAKVVGGAAQKGRIDQCPGG